MSENAGEYNRVISVQKRTGAVNSSNQPIDVWEDVHPRLWAKIRGETGMANIRTSGENQGIMGTIVRKSFRIRHRTDINEGMRVVRRGVCYDIKKIEQDEAGLEWTDLIGEAGGNDG